MNTLRACVMLGGIVLGAIAAWGQTIEFVVVERAANYVQTGPTTVVVDTFNPARFSVGVEGDAFTTSSTPITAASFTAPGGSAQALTFDPSEQTWHYAQNFSSMAALNGAYTTGSYTFNLTGTPSGPASVSVSGFPGSQLQIPQLTLSGGAWSGSVYQIVSGAVLSVAFNPVYSGVVSSTTGFHYDAYVSGPGGYDETEGFVNFNPISNSVVSGGATPSAWILVAPPVTGIYQLEVGFTQIENAAPIYSSSFSASLLQYRTGLSIMVIPEPSTWAALLLGLAAIGLQQLRRRRA